MMMTLGQVEHWTNGATLFEHAATVTDRNARAYSNAGFARAQLGDYPTAVSHYTKALAVMENSETWNNLAAALIHLDRNAEAAIAAQHALDLEPESGEARFNLASACERSGDETRAIATYREAMSFAILGALCQDRIPITLPHVTGCPDPAPISGAWILP